MLKLFAFLLNIFFAFLYLWAAEYNRYICVALWAIAPLANIALFAVYEKSLFN